MRESNNNLGDGGPSWFLKPRFHLKALVGWMNDPCAPGYDVHTGTYHLFYQWNPRSCDWGHICYGHYISLDGVHWKHYGKTPVLEPSTPYDSEGIFTGCLHPSGPRGESEQLTIIYSSICHMPISWQIPYQRDCAGISLATSGDHGRTWQRSSSNPVLKGEPDDLTVTGFRDPYVATWPALDQMRRSQDELYAVVSGGILEEGPAIFLYSVSRHDLSSWEYLGPALTLPLNFQPSKKWNGDFGANWECASFMTLKDQSTERQFLLLGSEGGLEPSHPSADEEFYRTWCLWLSGRPTMDNDGAVKISYDYSGILDHGCFYAPASYEHPVTKERVVWGWLKEEDLTIERREAKGWAGHLSVPREVFLLTIPNVIKAIRTPLEELACFARTRQHESSTFILETLGMRPLPTTQQYLADSPRVFSQLAGSDVGNGYKLGQSSHWYLMAEVTVHETIDRVGFVVAHSSDLLFKTTISFSLADEEIVVDRSLSNPLADVLKTPVKGPFTLFTLQSDDKGEILETLRFEMFGDGNVLEIFVNDRFALSTMIYYDTDRDNGISCFVEGSKLENAVFESVLLWEKMDRIIVG